MILLTNARIVTSEGIVEGYVAVEGDYISAVEEGEPPESIKRTAQRVEDIQGRYLMPGAIDTHVHFREPGLTRKGDMTSESFAALMGGVTTVLEMPNTLPPTTSREAWQWKMDRAAEVSRVNYGFFIGATADNLDELRSMDYTACPGVKFFMGSSTGGMLLADDEDIKRMLREVDAQFVVHAEDEATICKNALAAKAAGEVPVAMHSAIRSTEACVKATRRVVELAEEAGARLHVAHVSTAEELPLLQGKRGITSETGPQYLLFDETSYATLGARVKCNPAVKTPADRKALIEALRSGAIDTVASDHAPHQLIDKQGDALTAASGMPGVQFTLPLMLSLYDDPQLVARVTSQRPAEIFGIEGRGRIAPGCFADIVEVERLRSPHIITSADVVSACHWSPYEGLGLRWKVRRAMVNGGNGPRAARFAR